MSSPVGSDVVLWALMLASVDVYDVLTLAFAVPAAGFLVRLFMIRHDCGHGSFFSHRAANDALGRGRRVGNSAGLPKSGDGPASRP